MPFLPPNQQCQSTEGTAADNTASTILTAEVDTYLASNSADTASLTAFPHIAAAFRKYTTKQCCGGEIVQ